MGSSSSRGWVYHQGHVKGEQHMGVKGQETIWGQDHRWEPHLGVKIMRGEPHQMSGSWVANGHMGIEFGRETSFGVFKFVLAGVRVNI